jgi:hypothetical protein
MLLAHSQSLCNAAEAGDWPQFAILEAPWHGLLQQAVQQYGSQLNPIGAQLLADNKIIRQLIERQQHQLAIDLQENNRANSAVKQYLK